MIQITLAYVAARALSFWEYILKLSQVFVQVTRRIRISMAANLNVSVSNGGVLRIWIEILFSFLD